MNNIQHSTIASLGPFWITLIVGIICILVFYVVKRSILKPRDTGERSQYIRRRLNIAEKLFWPVFVMAIFLSIIAANPSVGIALSIFLASVLWKPLTNYFFGLTYKLGNTYQTGQRITFQDHRGSIKSLNNLSLELELEAGGFLDIPYRILGSNLVQRTSKATGVLAHSLIVSLSKPCDIEQEKKQLRAKLLSIPYVLPTHKISFDHLDDEDEEHRLKITIYGVDKGQMHKVEEWVRSQYEA